MKDFIIDLVMIAILSIVPFFMLYGIVSQEVLCSISIIIGLTWWLICYKHKVLINEINDLKKEIKKIEEKK